MSTAWQAGSNYVKVVIKKEKKKEKKKIRVAGLDIDSYTTILIHIKLSSSLFLTFEWCAKIHLLPAKLANEALRS